MDSKIEILNQIYESIITQDIDTIIYLLKSTDVNVNLIIPDKEMTLLHLAVGVDPSEFAEMITKLILLHNGNPNECNDEKMTPLHVAASWGREEIVKILLDSGGDPYLRDDEFNTPLDYAIENQHGSTAECISDYLQNDYNAGTISPEMYSLKLDKLIIDDGDYIGEYSLHENEDVDFGDSKYIETDPIRKSVYIKQWCDSTKKLPFRKSACGQDIFRNKNGDIMFKKPIYFDKIDHKELEVPEAINVSKKSEYHSCNDTMSNISSYVEKNTVNSSSIGDDEFSSGDDSLSGIDILKFTKNEHNDIYSIIHKNTLLGTENIPTTPSKSNSCILPNSPVPFPHVNYNSKTTLRSEKKKHNDSIIENVLDVDEQVKNDLFGLNIDDHLIKNDVDKYQNDGNKIAICNRNSKRFNNAQNHDETLASVVEQYKYEDKEAGIVLIENRALRSLIQIPQDGCDKSVAPSIISSVSSLPLSVDYDTDGLRNELKSHGLIPGPITDSTKKVYLRKLQRLRKKPYFPNPQTNSKKKTYTVELEKTFRDPTWYSNLSLYISLEEKIIKQFESPNPNIRWREGVIKSSFTYLLLDPRITSNLPSKANSLEMPELWRLFIDSIFYIGKGKRSRPYSHLYQAVTLFNAGQKLSPDKKVQNILDIWSENLGVVCLHIFQNVIPVEAYTREAAMIDVIGLRNLKNIKPGNYYGVASSWPLKNKKLLGLYLLYRAMLIFFNEGERQLRPADIC